MQARASCARSFRTSTGRRSLLHGPAAAARLERGGESRACRARRDLLAHGRQRALGSHGTRALHGGLPRAGAQRSTATSARISRHECRATSTGLSRGGAHATRPTHCARRRSSRRRWRCGKACGEQRALLLISVAGVLASSGVGRRCRYRASAREHGTKRSRSRKPRGSASSRRAVEPKWATGTRITVEVLNATKVARARAPRRRCTLRDQGFDVVSTGTNRDQFDSTLVLDRTGHRDWAERAAKAMGGARCSCAPTAHATWT